MNDYNNLNDYLDKIYRPIDPSIKLDDDQKRAVLADDNCALIVAGAGTGKTAVIASKVRYLVDIKKVPPEKILVMSYTRKAVEELRRRISIDFNIPAHITTFHSLGLKYLRYLNYPKKVCAIDSNEKKEYFVNFFREIIFSSKESKDDFVESFNDKQITWSNPRDFTYGKFFLENYDHFITFDDYFEAYIQKKIRETDDIAIKVSDIADQKVNGEYPVSIRGERMKSKGEAIIANYLYCNDIDYSYERVYDELVGDMQTYKPDFSIDVGGETIYVEYFGLSGSKLDNQSYQRIRRKKEEYHRQKHNKFISLDYLPNRGYLKVLANKLKELRVQLHPKPIEEIYYELLKQNPLAELYHLENFFYNIIDTIKSSEKVDNFQDYKKLCLSYADSSLKERQLRWIERFWEYYYSSKNSDSSIIKLDYSDMITLPLGQIHKIIPSKLDYRYILVDEYQDISAARFRLLNETIKASNAKFYAIGDDWQSIFSFQGAKIDYILDFEDYFPDSKQYFIRNVYRNANSLVESSSKFVLRNSKQIKKSGLKSSKDVSNPIYFVEIKGNMLRKTPNIDDRNNAIESMIRQIHHMHPRDSICVIGRTNSIVRTLFKNPNFVDSAESKIRIKGVNNFYFDAITIHKSKGLTYDWVIILPLTSYFPSGPKNIFWALDIIKNEPPEEPIPYAEQRRLFYVALTRTKNRVYILMPQKGKHSKYKDELKMIIEDLESQKAIEKSSPSNNYTKDNY